MTDTINILSPANLAKITDLIKLNDATKSNDHIKNIIVAAAILTLMYGIADTIYGLMETNKKIRVIYGQLSLPVYYAILGFGFIIALENLGFSQPALFALLGTFSLTLALSLQQIFTSVIAGIYIGFKNSFKIDDAIIVDTNGKSYEGIVLNVDLFDTIIMLEDGSKQIIPNTNIKNGILRVKKQKKKKF